jgi:hypothetical protein
MPPAPEVLNARTAGKSAPGAIYVGRPSPWGNPFSIGRDGDRDAVISKYVAWLHGKPDLVARARRELAGHDLICWCAPQACHAEILRDLALGLPLPPVPGRAARRQADLFDGPA